MLIVAALTAVGVALRLAVAQQSLFADELSTRYVIAGHGLADVISVVHTDAEITPPLYFVASWLTTRIDLTPELLRAPSLAAGAAAIPLVYLLGLRTVGRRAGLVAAALTAFSPFMVFYSTEARGYELMVVLVLGSTLCLLAALERGRARWWAGYAICTCAAVYTHYTAVFALAGQLLWVLWAHPAARRAALLATAAAAFGFLPWLSGLRGDLESPTTDILSALQPFDVGYVRSSLAHWAVGFPYATPESRLADLPGVPALVALGLAVALGAVGLAAATLRGRRRRPSPELVLVVVLALSVPVGEAIASAVGSNLLGARNLAGSWPAFAVCLAALLLAAGRRLGIVAAVLAIAAFAAGGLKLLDRDFRRPDYDGAAAFIDRAAAPGDVVVDGVSLSPAGVPTTLDVAFAGRRRVFALGRDRVRYDPFRILAPAPPAADVVRSAAAAAGRRRLFLVLAPGSTLAREALAAVPPEYRRVAERGYPGINDIEVLEYAAQTASGA
jgi:mannosyltransferase